MERLTLDGLRKILIDGIASEHEEISANMLKWCEDQQGKPLNAKKLPGDSWRRKETWGCDEIWVRNGDPLPDNYTTYYLPKPLLGENFVRVPTPEAFAEQNLCHYAGAHARNEQRRVLLNDPGAMDALIVVLEQHREAEEASVQALRGMPDQYAIQRARGNMR